MITLSLTGLENVGHFPFPWSVPHRDVALAVLRSGSPNILAGFFLG